MSPARIPDAQRQRSIHPRQRNLQVESRTGDAAGHGPVLGMRAGHRTIEDILEAGKLRDGFRLRPLQHLVRRALRDDVSFLQHNCTLAQRKDFLAVVGNVENGNPMPPIPGAQIVDDPRFRDRIQRGERFVQQQQRAAESPAHAPAQPAGVLQQRFRAGRRCTSDGMRNDSKHFTATSVALALAERGQAVLHILLDRHVRK